MMQNIPYKSADALYLTETRSGAGNIDSMHMHGCRGACSEPTVVSMHDYHKGVVASVEV